jgi:hypothetical protein
MLFLLHTFFCIFVSSLLIHSAIFILKHAINFNFTDDEFDDLVELILLYLSSGILFGLGIMLL